MNEKVKQAVERLRELDLYDLHSEDIKTIETALNKAEDYEIQNTIFKEPEKELIAEQHRLFDLAKEQENELKELKRFAEVVIKKQVRMHWLKGSCLERYNRDIKYNFEDYASDYMLTQAEFELVKKVVEKYGK